MTPDERRESEGRVDNAAVAKAPGTSEERPASYPACGADESLDEPGEPRSFDPPRTNPQRANPQKTNPQPRRGAGDGGPPPAHEAGRMGPAGDPAEGKR